MARCQLSNEDECHGHDCITRVGTPCVYDIQGTAGTEDLQATQDPETCWMRPCGSQDCAFHGPFFCKHRSRV